ncbi:type IV secretion system DNA-binding domain-containing protein [Allokutzneria sp. A3M-2-11 16]|uniref:type IV secretory system conjugative DNA transfer family protein n=1 Tax=Allokutzneria sp. A3M-2-11 16 TaxID=2962043 RepID=UPI0020B7FA5F|nr:type IV secretion system DNA-binding domain-containing protein [Allokutzneria sp. A3M-2-11 16]MCP3797986.1 type IV secretion system DNA-binding domain-containing protein [Allokutzneria sp. A3M-2-11 16]
MVHQEPAGSCRRYSLVFPANVQPAQVQAWLRALAGALGAPHRRDAVAVLELQADARGLQHRLVIPPRHADYAVAQLRTLIPGVRVAPQTDPTRTPWTSVVELTSSSPKGDMNLPSIEAAAATVMAAMQGTADQEALLLQVAVTPAMAAKAVKNDRSTHKAVKAVEPGYLVSIRIAARSDDAEHAQRLLRRVQAAVGSTASSGARFRRKLTFSKAALSKKIEQAKGNLMYSTQLSVIELSALLGWPIGSPHVAGLPQGRTRQLPASAAVPRKGKVIGRSNFPGAERPVAVAARQAVKHLHVVGPTGTGKTTLLANLVAQDMKQGYGVIVLESKGDLFQAALDRVPRRRIKDVIVLDVNDATHPVGFNVLSSGTTRSAVDELSALITNLYGDGGGVYAPMLLYYGLHALAETPGSTFIDLPSMLTPQGPEEVAWRDQVVGSVKNRDVHQFWQRYLSDSNKERDRMAAPVHNRIWQLAVRPEIRNIIGQSTSSFTFEEVLQDNKILLINLNSVRVGEQTASLTGTLLMNALWSAVRTVKKTKPSFLYLDEFQDFVNLPISAADMLAKTRSFNLGLVLAHQDLDQLSKVRGLEQAVLANARSKVVFQTSSRDARALQREFGRLVDEEDFLNLAAYEAIVRIATEDGVSSPITVSTNPAMKPTGVANAVRLASRTTYGRPIAEVEAQIDVRRRGSDRTKTKPKLGAQKWG